ncbi:MAG: GGDEF domain-containing protein [Hyphomonas sp.]|nr:GGDEF domain-containing protein [Hyphomonas sp.]
MADDVFSPRPDRRRALVEILGVNLAGMDRHTRAAIEALCDEVIALREELGEVRSALSEAELLADNDALCPLFNRRAFEREVRREIALATRFRTPLCLIFVDLDNFKPVNDVFGHATGDAVLIRVSEILKGITRETDIVGRLGGDEFGMVLSQATLDDSNKKAAQVTERIDDLVVRSPDNPDEELIIGASCGVVAWQPGEDAEHLIARADQAMFAQKSRRKRGRSASA